MADTQDDIVYNAQLDAFTLYHMIQEEAGKTSSLGGGPILPALGHAVAGSAATAATKLLLYPLDLVITRLQVQRQLSGPKEAPSAARDADAEYENLIDAARKIYDTEGGLKAFYTGLAPDVLKGLADSFLFFLVYNFLRQRQTKKLGSSLPVHQELGIGVGAGALARFVTTPLQNIITRQQTAALVAARDPTFLIAATSKAIATAITYPVSLAKSRAQTKAPTEDLETEVTEKDGAYVPPALDEPEMNATPKRRKATDHLKKVLRLMSAQYAVIVSLRKIYRSEGVSGLYSGLEAEVLKGFLSHGLTMAMKESVHVGVIQLYYALLKLTRKWPAELQKAQVSASHAIDDAKEHASHAVEDVKEKAESVAASGKQVVWGGEKKD